MTSRTVTGPPVADSPQLSDPAFWLQPDDTIDEAFAWLRREDPVSFQQEVSFPPVIEQGPGYWALSRYDDIVAVTRDAKTFCSGKGITVWDWPPDLAEAFSHMLAQDAPEHTRLRRIVLRAFTPAAMRRLRPEIARHAAEVVDEICERGEINFVSDVAARYPVRIICEMLGVPAEYHDLVAENTTEVVRVADPALIAGAADPAARLGQIVAAGGALAALVMQLAADRRANPRGDLISELVTADINGEALDDIELTRFFILLAVGGADTTRAALSHGMIALSRFPDQRRAWMDDFDAYATTAPDEIIRWATPLIHFRRTATVDTTLGGRDISAGDKVVMFYRSGNMDESVFDRPTRFDIARPSQPAHLAFGARGVHHCLGHHLARTQIAAIFRELFARLPDIEVSGPPVREPGSQVHGIKDVPCTFTPVQRPAFSTARAVDRPL